MPKSEFNKFFDRIFVINLASNLKRWKDVEKRFKSRGIQVERFIAVDGRCKNEGHELCLAKLRTFELIYNVKIPFKKGEDLKTLVPVASLTIGTILLLRAMVKHKWKRMLICEDDIHLTPKIEMKFKQGIKELGSKRWDLLYLGCGASCGHKGVSWEKTKKNKHVTPWYNKKGDDKWYVAHKNDLRSPCDGEDCPYVTEHISRADSPGGSWCYAYSLSGAKKVLKAIDNNVAEHIDQLLIGLVLDRAVTSLAFDPPIVWHENIRGGRITDLPW